MVCSIIKRSQLGFVYSHAKRVIYILKDVDAVTWNDLRSQKRHSNLVEVEVNCLWGSISIQRHNINNSWTQIFEYLVVGQSIQELGCIVFLDNGGDIDVLVCFVSSQGDNLKNQLICKSEIPLDAIEYLQCEIRTRSPRHNAI